ncbi:MAG: hypothetical protein K2G70_03820 [Turicibacter sp.]|nr:hypothetical protein [Turicibacter sp.]
MLDCKRIGTEMRYGNGVGVKFPYRNRLVCLTIDYSLVALVNAHGIIPP